MSEGLGKLDNEADLLRWLEKQGFQKASPGGITIFSPQGPLRLVWGVVTSAAGISAGSGFTVDGTAGTGLYTVTFDTAYATLPAVVLTTSDTYTAALNTAATTTAVPLSIRGNTTGTLTNVAFSFAAIGPA